MTKPSRKIRLSDLASHCGVSQSTASRALSGTPGVREDLRRKILEAARALNYHVPTNFTGTRVIVAASAAAMIDFQRQQFTAYVLEGLRDRAQALGITLETRSVGNAAEERRLLEEAMATKEIVGLLFLTIDEEDMLASTRGLTKPVILVNGDDPDMRLSSVVPYNRAAAGLAVRHLRALGHERILFMARPGRTTIQRRMEGWRDSILPLAGDGWRDLVADAADWTPEAAREVLRAHIDRHGRNFTAILAAGDILAVGAIMGLKEMGLSVPGDISVVGIDGLPQSDFLDPPLTSVHIPMREIGAEAMNLLRDHIEDRTLIPRRLELSCRLVERASTGPVAPA
ncbi:MAG: LacI family DNA-binding transcriptional regulator [Tropicimonas sp.]|uniref:LacI family DNA-binding transcriptional regulator n=1 Tax=Tropicimonas sp. TaxID=2067044 RepID=UPI003A86CD97